MSQGDELKKHNVKTNSRALYHALVGFSNWSCSSHLSKPVVSEESLKSAIFISISSNSLVVAGHYLSKKMMQQIAVYKSQCRIRCALHMQINDNVIQSMIIQQRPYIFHYDIKQSITVEIIGLAEWYTKALKWFHHYHYILVSSSWMSIYIRSAFLG